MVGQGVVGVLGAPAVARVDERGHIELDACTLGWFVGAEDRWHDPRDDTAVRQERLAPAPAYETRMRVPSGDAIQRVYAARGRDGHAYVVVDIENGSPAPFAIAFVIRAAAEHGRQSISLDEHVVSIDDRASLVLPRPPMRWAAADAATGTYETVTSGAAREGAFETVRAVCPEAAFLFPVAHRTSVRVALVLDVTKVAAVRLDELPGIDALQRGWAAQLDRAMRAEVPGILNERIDGARAAALLEGDRRDVSAATIANLEDWAFDDEAAAAWGRASFRTRRRARVRSPIADVQSRIASATDEEILRYARDVLVLDRGAEVDILPGFVPAWVGEPIAVHDAPTRAGLVSFAVRWHGERPALLWDAPPGVVLRAPVLDPDWSAGGGRGEALLRAWPRPAASGESFA
jgi:hypothetical protein